MAGGRLFIPVPTGSAGTYALEEREYGVGVKFTPTVLDGGRINLKVAPEVSDLGKGTSFKVNAVETVLPNFTTNRVQTTVQLMDGQSLAIAGLIKNNVGEVVSRVPLLGEIPILGTLFRSSEFQSNRTELVFLITPHLIKPLAEQPKLPTDSFTPPSRSEFFWEGKLEGSGNAEVVPDKPVARLAPPPSVALPQAAVSASTQPPPLLAAPAQQAGSVSAAAVAPAAPAPAEPPAAEQMSAPPPLNGLPEAPTPTEQVSPPLLAPAASPQGDPMLTVQADPVVLELE